MMLRPQSQWILLVVLTAVALYLCWMVLRPFLPVLLWAAVLALVFHPAHRQVLRRLPYPPLAAFVSTALVIVTFIVPVVVLSSVIVAQLQGFAASAQDQVTALMTDPHQAERLQALLTFLDERFGIRQGEIRTGLQQAAAAASEALVRGTVNVLGGALGFVLSTFFVTFAMYYLFRDGERAVEALRAMLPLDPEQSERLVWRAADIVSASVYGVVVVAIIQGSLGGLMFWVLGLPAPLVWGVVMIVLAMIPMLGPFVVWVPFAIFLAASGQVTKALVLTLWGVLVIGLVDNVLRPRLVGQRTRMHELLVFFSVLGGLQVFGALGLLLGPVVVALGQALLEAFRAADDAARAAAAAPMEATASGSPPRPGPGAGDATLAAACSSSPTEVAAGSSQADAGR